FLAMTQDSFVSKERLRGYMDTMQKHGFTPNDHSIVTAGRTIESGRIAMEKLHAKNSQLTAVFASNDLLGIGALEWLAIKNIKVPEQISIIGFDDLVFSSLYWIQLTTMAQPRKKMGRFAADLLLTMINGSEENESVLLKAKLVERKTCRVVTTV